MKKKEGKMKKKIEELNGTVSKMNERIEELENKIDRQEQYSRYMESLRIKRKTQTNRQKIS